jgi:3-oxoacyl-[acyl-carrier protein] reductase
MSQDLLLDIGKNQMARQVIKKLRLPLNLPPILVRDENPWGDLPLKGLTLGVGGDRKSKSIELLRALVISAGAQATHVYGSAAKLNGLIFDASEARSVQDLGLLYDFIKPRLQTLSSGARIVILARSFPKNAPHQFEDPEGGAVSRSLSGFVKSLAKELGRKGTTVNLIELGTQNITKNYLIWPLVFFLSNRSSFISGQRLIVSSPFKNEDEGNSELNFTSFKESLKGKKALVTGAAHGIGKEICRWLSLEGAEVIGLDHPVEKDALVVAMEKINGKYFLADLLDPHSFPKIQMWIEKEFGTLDILVSNAGLTRDKTLARMPRDYWDDVLQVNLKAAIDLVQSLVIKPQSQNRLISPSGRIILMSSISGISGNAGQTNYATAKAGLIGFIEQIAPQLSPYSITINAIAPGFIETRMTASMPFAIREFARRFNALNQGGLTTDVAQAVTFLASPGTFGITGQTLRVCGLNFIGA